MEFSKFSQNLADEISADFTEYDANHSVLVVPLKDGRYQTVVIKLMEHPKFKKEVVRITSKVCYTSEDINYKELLTASDGYVHTNFTIEDDVLKVEASLFYESIDGEILREIVKEVASIADDWEFKITGVDTF